MKRIKTGKIKTVLSFLMGIWLFVLVNGPDVLADGTLQIGIDQYEVTEDGSILVYVNQNETAGFEPHMEESSLLIGKNSLPVEEILSFDETGEPVTYLCLVDISGSMTEDGIAQTKEVLKQLASKKGELDNFCITTMGNDVSSSGFLTDRSEVEAAIDGIERISTEDTNLYYSITEALNDLKTDKAVHKKRCLLIFSDGEDDQKKGITQKEAVDAVKENHIPVFTVALPGAKLKDEEGSAKILGSFARNSAGGEHFAPLLDDRYEYEDICDHVNTRLRESLVVRASLENVKEVGDDTVYIGVELSDGVKKASDGITVPAGSILEVIEAIEEAQKGTGVQVTVINDNSEKEEAPTEEPPVEEPKRLNKKIIIGICLLFIVAILILIFILCRKKPEEESYEEETNGGYESGGNLGEAFMGPGLSYESGRTQAMSGLPVEAEPEAPKKSTKKGKIQVTLFRVGPGEVESHQITVKDRAAIGRNKSCQLSFDNDSALSGVHCSILYHDGAVFVRDEGSTNGTFVNGVPIVGEFKVEKDDVLLIGSSEFRIFWE